MAHAALLLPPLLLALGALACQRLAHLWPTARARIPVVSAGFATLAAMGLVAWVVAVRPLGVPSLSLTLSPWSRATFGTEPGVEVDLLAALCMTLICASVWVGSLRGWAEDEDPAAAGWPLWVAAASVLFVAAACAPLGLPLAWMALDCALFLASGGRRRGLLAGQAGLMLALAGLAALPFNTASLSTPTPATLPLVSRQLVLAACMIRMGLYPLWWSVPHTDQHRPWHGVAMRVAPTLAGAYLVLRVAAMASPLEEVSTWAILPGLVSLTLGAALAWIAGDRIESLDWSTTVQASLVLIAAGIGGPSGQAIALVLVLDLALGRTARFAGTGFGRSRLGRGVRWMAGASMAGLPPTLGFVGRWLLYRELLTRDLTVALWLIVLALALASTPALVGAGPEPPLRQRSRWVLGAIAACAALQLVLGLGFRVLQPVLQALTTTSLYDPLLDLWQTMGQLVQPAQAADWFGDVVLLLAILLPPAVGGLLNRRRRPLGAAPVAVPERRHLRRALLLENSLREGLSGLIRGGEAVQLRTAQLEDRRTLAWTLLAVAAIGAMMLGLHAPAGGAPLAAAPSTALALLFFLMASGVAALMVVGTAPISTLGALALGYVLCGALLVLAAGANPGLVLVVALIKFIAGALVVAILGISVLQAPASRRLPAAAGRLRRLSAAPADSAERVLPVMALAVALVLAYGVPSPVSPAVLAQAWPAAILRPAMALVAGGALSVLFSRSPLRLAGGVLMALAGFELVSARLDPGLVVTTGLAAFQLLFAIVASHFVGLGELGHDSGTGEF